MSEEELRQYCKDASNEIIKLGEENTKLKSVLKEIREYIIKNCDFNGTAFYDKWVSGKVLLEIIDKGTGEDR